MYPSEWKGSVESASGVANFKIEGLDFAVRLECFADYQMVSNMLDLAFTQGKKFAANAMRSHVTRAMDQAVSDHAL